MNFPSTCIAYLYSVYPNWSIWARCLHCKHSPIFLNIGMFSTQSFIILHFFSSFYNEFPGITFLKSVIRLSCNSKRSWTLNVRQGMIFVYNILASFVCVLDHVQQRNMMISSCEYKKCYRVVVSTTTLTWWNLHGFVWDFMFRQHHVNSVHKLRKIIQKEVIIRTIWNNCSIFITDHLHMSFALKIHEISKSGWLCQRSLGLQRLNRRIFARSCRNLFLSPWCTN